MIEITFDTDIAKVKGEIDIFCAEKLKETVKEHGFANDFTMDLQEVPYIDSSGIGALISLYNYYEQKGISFTILPSQGVRKVFAVSKLDTIFFKDKPAHKDPKEHIVFYDSFEADTRILSFLIDKLFRDLENAKYDSEEAQEIVVAVDEAITNAILETIKATGEVVDDLTITFDPKAVKSIAVRWEITPEEFFATVIDHGSGLDLQSIKSRVPQVNKEDYLSQVKTYQDKCNLHLRLNGEEIELKRLGAGLKIMANFMDSIFIDLIDSRQSVTTTVNKSTMGTILNLYRQRRTMPAS